MLPNGRVLAVQNLKQLYVQSFPALVITYHNETDTEPKPVIGDTTGEITLLDILGTHNIAVVLIIGM